MNRLVAVFLGLYIVAEYGITYLGFMVRAWSIRRGVLGLIVQAPVDPRNHVPNLKTRILNPHRHPVLCARASKRQQMPAGLQHPQALGPDRHAGHVVVPALPHEGQAVGRIRHHGIHAAIRHGAQHFQAVAQVQGVVSHCIPLNPCTRYPPQPVVMSARPAAATAFTRRDTVD